MNYSIVIYSVKNYFFKRSKTCFETGVLSFVEKIIKY